MSDDTEQERAVANALSVCVDGMPEPKPDENDWADAKRMLAYLARAGYVLVERALVVEAADGLDPSCSDMRLLALASRLRRAAAAGNGEG